MLMQFFRVDVVPTPVAPGVCYVTRNGVDDTSVLHFVSRDGGEIHTVGHPSDSPLSALHSVADILERDTLILHDDALVMVIDASGDPNITSGSAMYYYVHSTATYVLSSTQSGTGTGHSHLSTLTDIDKAATLAANNHIPMGSDPEW